MSEGGKIFERQYKNILSPCRPASQNTASAMTIADLSPKLALQRLLMLYENGEHRSVLAVELQTKVREDFTITEKALLLVESPN